MTSAFAVVVFICGIAVFAWGIYAALDIRGRRLYDRSPAEYWERRGSPEIAKLYREKEGDR